MQTFEERRAVALRGLAELSDALVDERALDLSIGHADRERDRQQRAEQEKAEHTPRDAGAECRGHAHHGS